MTPFHDRADWGARPPRVSPSRIASEGQTLHYGGGSPWGSSADRSTPERFAASTDHARCPTIVRAWQSFHIDGRGWNDLAYNSGVCPHGHRYEGRGVNRRSAANGTNTGNDRSCATVYIAGGDDPVTDGAKQAFHDEAQRFGVHLRWNHGDWKSTSCAGVPIRAWQADGFPRPSTPHPTPTPTPITEDDDMLIIWLQRPKGKGGADAYLLNGGKLGHLATMADIAALKKAGVAEATMAQGTSDAMRKAYR